MEAGRINLPPTFAGLLDALSPAKTMFLYKLGVNFGCVPVTVDDDG